MLGSYRARGGLWTERLQANPFAQARSSLDVWLEYAHEFKLGHTPSAFRAMAGVHGEYDAAYLCDRSSYDPETLAAYEHQIYDRETYASVTLGHFQVASGRMIVPLGQGEILDAIDVLNPRDQREPGLTEVDRLRLPVFMTRASIGLDAHRLEAIVVHEATFGLIPPPLGDYSPLRKLLVSAPVGGSELASYQWSYQQNPTGLDVAAWQTVEHYGFTAESIDLDLYAGSVLDRLGVTVSPPPQAYQNRQLVLQVYHPRYTMAAHSGAWTVGPLVVRWEIGADFSRPETVRLDGVGPLQFAMDRRTQVNGMLGVTYFSSFDANIGLEVMKSFVIDDPGSQGIGQSLLWPVEDPAFALRWTQDLAHERLKLEAVGVLVGLAPLNGALLRAELRYALVDSVHLGLGYVHYVATSAFGPFFGFDANDRAYTTLRWDFALR